MRQVRKNTQIIPLGDKALLVRFGDRLSGSVNERAVEAALLLNDAEMLGVEEVCPTLVSVLVRYDPANTSFLTLSNNVRMILYEGSESKLRQHKQKIIQVKYGGEGGPDLENVAKQCGLSIGNFIEAHGNSELRVLANGFAPGFVYCGMHPKNLHIPRRVKLHASVASGSILFAAGQTALTATQVPTGWNLIGRTDFVNFCASDTPPSILRPGDEIKFVCAGVQ